MDVKLPIDVVPDTDPPIFRWRQAVDGYGGERVMVDYQEALPPNVEKAVQRLVGVAKQLLMENMALKGQARVAEGRTEDAALAKAEGVPVPRAGEPRPSPPARQEPARSTTTPPITRRGK